MIGVVVWSDEDREKAIIWCEDQGGLAYLQGRDPFECGEKWPHPGDMVEINTKVIADLRHVETLRLFCEQSCPSLPRMLRGQARPPGQPLQLVPASKSDTETLRPLSRVS